MPRPDTIRPDGKVTEKRAETVPVVAASFLGRLIWEVIGLAIDRGYDMQPEFDKNNSKASMVNYSKVKSGGEQQDDLRQRS